MKDSILKDQATTSATINSTNEISKVAVTTIGLSAGIIGVWAIACVVAGMSSNGGPVELISSLFKAIAG